MPLNSSTTPLNIHKDVHPVTFMILNMPFGIFLGFISVTMGYLLTKAGVSLAGVASVVSFSVIPNVLKFLWAPLVDTTLTTRKWYNMANIGTAAGLLIICLLPLESDSLTILCTVVLVASLANTVIAMSTESLLARNVPNEKKGRAGGWLQVGNLGGAGIGGGAGIWLAERLPDLWITGSIIAATCLICSLALLKLAEPVAFHKEKRTIDTIGKLGKDIWVMIKSNTGFLALILCLMPIGSGAASNLWSSIHKDWHASPYAVALSVGIFGGIMSAIGCLMGGWLCDRIDRKRAYVIFGLLEALCALSMALSPRTEIMYMLWTSLYAITVGLVYAGFSAFVLEAIGKNSPATKYNVFAAISNTPLYVMLFIDQYAYGRWNATGMLITETILTVIGVTLFLLAASMVNNKKKISIQLVSYQNGQP